MPPLADVAARVLLPTPRFLDTGLRVLISRTTRAPITEVNDVNRLIAGSNTPNDDKDLYNAHPPIGAAAVHWANPPSASTDVQLEILKFATPADASAVNQRILYQEQHKLERLADLMVDPTYDTRTDPLLGTMDVIKYFQPAQGSVSAALITRTRGTLGQYLFEVRAREAADANHNPTGAKIDPGPSTDEVLTKFAALATQQLNLAPPTTQAS
jgi:hypothetical protein